MLSGASAASVATRERWLRIDAARLACSNGTLTPCGQEEGALIAKACRVPTRPVAAAGRLKARVVLPRL